MLDGELNPDLIVSLSGAAVRHGVCALGYCDLNELLRYDRTGKSGTQQVIFIFRSRLDRRDDNFVYKFIAQIDGVELVRPGLVRFLFEPFQLVLLPDVPATAIM